MSRFEAASDLPKQIVTASTQDRANAARQAAAIARLRAPVVSGAYRGGIAVRVNTGTGEVSLVDTDPLAAIKEFGTIDTPAHLVLTDAARAFGKLVGSAGSDPA